MVKIHPNFHFRKLAREDVNISFFWYMCMLMWMHMCVLLFVLCLVCTCMYGGQRSTWVSFFKYNVQLTPLFLCLCEYVPPRVCMTPLCVYAPLPLRVCVPVHVCVCMRVCIYVLRWNLLLTKSLSSSRTRLFG